MEDTIIVPIVNMGATLCSGSDRYPYTIIEVSENGKTITMQQDKHKRIDKNGLSENQEYEYTRDTNGNIIKVSLRKDGKWKEIGNKYHIVIVGHKEKYINPSY